MELPPPKTLALALRTPSVEMKYWEAEDGEVSANVMWKFSRNDTLGFEKGTPPLSKSSTLKFWDKVEARGHPAVPPPTMM